MSDSHRVLKFLMKFIRSSIGGFTYLKSNYWGFVPIYNYLNIVHKIKRAVEAPCLSTIVSIRFFIELKWCFALVINRNNMLCTLLYIAWDPKIAIHIYRKNGVIIISSDGHIQCMVTISNRFRQFYVQQNLVLETAKLHQNHRLIFF